MKNNLIKFVKSTILLLGIVSFFVACQGATKTKKEAKVTAPYFKLSLAQWSVHKQIIEGKLDPVRSEEHTSELQSH